LENALSLFKDGSVDHAWTASSILARAGDLKGAVQQLQLAASKYKTAIQKAKFADFESPAIQKKLAYTALDLKLPQGTKQLESVIAQAVQAVLAPGILAPGTFGTKAGELRAAAALIRATGVAMGGADAREPDADLVTTGQALLQNLKDMPAEEAVEAEAQAGFTFNETYASEGGKGATPEGEAD
jgi:hypothetical protein